MAWSVARVIACAVCRSCSIGRNSAVERAEMLQSNAPCGRCCLHCLPLPRLESSSDCDLHARFWSKTAADSGYSPSLLAVAEPAVSISHAMGRKKNRQSAQLHLLQLFTPASLGQFRVTELLGQLCLGHNGFLLFFNLNQGARTLLGAPGLTTRSKD